MAEGIPCRISGFGPGLFTRTLQIYSTNVAMPKHFLIDINTFRNLVAQFLFREVRHEISNLHVHI